MVTDCTYPGLLAGLLAALFWPLTCLTPSSATSSWAPFLPLQPLPQRALHAISQHVDVAHNTRRLLSVPESPPAPEAAARLWFSCHFFFSFFFSCQAYIRTTVVVARVLSLRDGEAQKILSSMPESKIEELPVAKNAKGVNVWYSLSKPYLAFSTKVCRHAPPASFVHTYACIFADGIRRPPPESHIAACVAACWPWQRALYLCQFV